MRVTGEREKGSVALAGEAGRNRRSGLRSFQLGVAILALLLTAAGCGGAASSADDPAGVEVATTGGGETVAEQPADEATTAAGGTETQQPADEGTSGELTEISFRLNTPAFGQHAPFLLASDLGYYEEEGVSVTFGEGTGSDTTAALVGEGDDHMGFADFTTIASFRERGAPIKSVGTVEQRAPFAITTLEDSDIDSADDLEGATVVMDRGDIPLFEAFAATAGFDADAVDTVTIAEEAQAAALAEGRIAGILGWTTYHSPQVQELTGGVKDLLWSDYGFEMLNLSVVANEPFLEENPDAVCGVVRAGFRAWEYAQDNPEEAIDALVAQFPNVNPTVAMGQLTNSFELLQTERSEGQPLGWVHEEDVINGLETANAAEGVVIQDPSAVYTNECYE